MRQEERFYLITELLRHSCLPVPAEALANELEVTTRTVHRDIAEMVKQGGAIKGGTAGYFLEQRRTRTARLTEQANVDHSAADDEAAARKQLREAFPKLMRVAEGDISVPKGFDVARAEEWVRLGCKLRISYSDGNGDYTRRTIWPVEISPHGRVRLVAAWCELREAFRQFRTDRILQVEFLEEAHSVGPETLKLMWETKLV